MNKKVLFILVSVIINGIFAVLPTKANVLINELMQSNFGGVIDYYNEYPDSWVELYNASDTDLDLKGWYIGEKNDINIAYKLPSSLKLAAKGYTLIYCDKEAFDQHTDFRLNSDKAGTVYLWDASGNLTDSLSYPEMINPEISWGRLADLTDSLSHFRSPTPLNENGNDNTERILKKVDFSEKGGLKKSPFFLKLSMKGDLPSDAYILYTTNGSEPTATNGKKYTDSIYIYQNTCIRAKVFSDSALSKISKTETYIFDQTAMPIVSIVCDKKYLYDSEIGIYTNGTYYNSHSDNPPFLTWLGTENYYYNWRRPANIEFYPNDASSDTLNQIGEIRVSGLTSRSLTNHHSLVMYANKRFGEKHFKGLLWPNLKPTVNKEKCIMVRSSGQDFYTYYFRDMFVQTAIGKYYKHFDVDYQAQRNVLLYLNGKLEYIMHLQERSDENLIWANHNKIEEIEFLDSENMNIDSFNIDNHPNFKKLKDTYLSESSTYQQMAEMVDLNEFMNYTSTQSFFQNMDWPYTNTAMWFDKQGTKKWRWILKDLDISFNYADYNFYDRIHDASAENPQTVEAFKIYNKLLSLDKFKQPYIDRTCVHAGSIFSSEQTLPMLDSMENEIMAELTTDDIDSYLWEMTDYHSWFENRPYYYYANLQSAFGLSDTTKLTIQITNHDSMTFFNNNPLVLNYYKGQYYVGRDIYLTHTDTLDIYGLKNQNSENISYLEMQEPLICEDSAATKWTVIYTTDGNQQISHYSNQDLHYKIIDGATDVFITDKYINSVQSGIKDIHVDREPQHLTYKVYAVNGQLIGSYTYEELKNYQQDTSICIVVAYDKQGNKCYSFKLRKKQ